MRNEYWISIQNFERRRSPNLEVLPSAMVLHCVNAADKAKARLVLRLRFHLLISPHALTNGRNRLSAVLAGDNTFTTRVLPRIRQLYLVSTLSLKPTSEYCKLESVESRGMLKVLQRNVA